WQMPFDSPHRLARAYLQPSSDFSAGHRGVDYAVTFGEPILAPSDGAIGFVGEIVDRPVLSLNHVGGFKTEFEPACSDLKVGTDVLAGQQIGWACAGSADYSEHCPSDDCLHFSLRLNGRYLSPLTLIGALNPSRLLP
ncbi:MAG: M23 family metallopeptidase, partial [Rhodoluna sp.]